MQRGGTAVVVTLGLLAIACSETPGRTGTLGGPCDEGGTCEDNLECLGDLCTDPDSIRDAAPDGALADVAVPDAALPDAFDGPLPDLGGEFFLALQPNGSGAPLLFIVTIDGFAESPSGATANLSFQPLTHDNTATPRQPTGNPIAATDVAIDTAGAFSVPLVGMIPGDANPLTGQPIDADVDMEATIVDGDNWCGTATGMLNQLVLSGATTFGATRVVKGTIGEGLPEPVLACE